MKGMKLEKFININWYLDRKPYAVHSDYDVFYLKTCRRLYSIIDELAINTELRKALMKKTAANWLMYLLHILKTR
jgi:hypothetical protein